MALNGAVRSTRRKAERGGFLYRVERLQWAVAITRRKGWPTALPTDGVIRLNGAVADHATEAGQSTGPRTRTMTSLQWGRRDTRRKETPVRECANAPSKASMGPSRSRDGKPGGREQATAQPA